MHVLYTIAFYKVPTDWNVNTRNTHIPKQSNFRETSAVEIIGVARTGFDKFLR